MCSPSLWIAPYPLGHNRDIIIEARHLFFPKWNVRPCFVKVLYPLCSICTKSLECLWLFHTRNQSPFYKSWQEVYSSAEYVGTCMEPIKKGSVVFSVLKGTAWQLWVAVGFGAAWPQLSVNVNAALSTKISKQNTPGSVFPCSHTPPKQCGLWLSNIAEEAVNLCQLAG